MRKTLLTLTLVLVTIMAQAQVRLGMKVGVNIANISELETSAKTSFYGGLVLNIKTSEKYTLQPELHYSKQGAKLDDENNTLEGTSNDIKLDYFSIGIINKFNVAKKVNFLFGPSIDLRVYENFDIYNDWDIFPHVDLAFIGGFEVNLTSNLSIEARYKQGIIDVLDYEDIYDYNYDDYDNDRETRNLNGVFQFGLTYTFDFK